MPPCLSIQHLSIQFQTPSGIIQAVDDVSLDIAAGEALGVVGESGCGKSTLAQAILRLIPSPPGYITHGKILFEGNDLLTLSLDDLRAIRGKDISMVFQDPMTALSPLCRIGNQLAETLRLHSRVSKKDALRHAAEWLEKVGIPATPDHLQSYPHQFSGGMQQRVMIASALMHHPKLIIADEPTTALDVTTQLQILNLMHDIKGSDASLLLISHDLGVIRKMCSRVAVMYQGKIVECATTGEIFSRPQHEYTKRLLAARR